MDDLGRSISQAFTFNIFDIPFALVYFCTRTESVTEESDELVRRSSSGSTSQSSIRNESIVNYTLQSTAGIPKGHELAPEAIEIRLSEDSNDTGFWPFRKMATEQVPIEVPLNRDTLEGIGHQPWPDFPKSAVVIPIFGARDVDGKELMTGMLIVGLNPRRVFDDKYLAWLRICSRNIGAAMNMTRNADEEAKRAEELAILNRNRALFFTRYFLAFVAELGSPTNCGHR